MQMRVGLISILACIRSLAAEPQLDSLPRFAPNDPAAALKTFVVREGFEIEAAAHEPNIASPVALSFDEKGRLYVIEMRDYSEHRHEMLGRVRLLEDLDGDGFYEKSVVFAEGLAWPTAVICYNGGVFVGATPEILFLKDTDGDGKADERKVVFTGFGKEASRLNVQQLINSFQWGQDNRIHGANGGNGGMIEQVASGAPALRLGSRDFSFDPKTLTMRAETGGGQHGMSFDDFGRKFVSNNSSHIRMAVYEDRYLQGVEGIALPTGLVDIAREGPAAEVFRISPEEPWRKVRTEWRVSGHVPGPIEGGGRASGYFTGATGVTIYRGDAFPKEFSNNAFVGDAGGNLVHRKVLKQAGVLFEASRAQDELNREFIASRDTWFRPIQFANGPDGCLYIIDMYREVIEHPWSLPPNLKRLIDLNSGREGGRIWRVKPAGFSRRAQPKLGDASTQELRKIASEHPNGWHRDTAARLLFERGNPVSRIALGDPNPGVVERSLINLETASSEDYDFALLAASADPRIRHQLAWTLSALQPKQTPELLATIIRVDASDPYIRAAVLVAAQNHAPMMFETLAADERFVAGEGAVEFLAQLAGRASTETLRRTISKIAPNAAGFQMASAVGEALQKRKTSSDLGGLFEAAVKAVGSADPSLQLAAIRFLRLEKSERTRTVFEKAFQSGAVRTRVEAFRELARDPKPASRLLLENWSLLPTAARQGALESLLSRDQGAELTIAALREKKLTRSDLTASQSQTLRQHSNPSISQPALELLGQAATDRLAVIERLKPAIGQKGDVKIGEKIFMERCATCHRVAGRGVAVGPDLESVRGNGADYILTHLIDPNREINALYTVYNAELRGDDAISGILARETDSTITFRLAGAEEKTVPRVDVKKLTASPQSLMPLGLEEGLDLSAVAGLLEFVKSAK